MFFAIIEKDYNVQAWNLWEFETFFYHIPFSLVFDVSVVLAVSVCFGFWVGGHCKDYFVKFNINA